MNISIQGSTSRYAVSVNTGKLSNNEKRDDYAFV